MGRVDLGNGRRRREPIAVQLPLVEVERRPLAVYEHRLSPVLEYTLRAKDAIDRADGPSEPGATDGRGMRR
jgi:hypothetical protein